MTIPIPPGTAVRALALANATFLPGQAAEPVAIANLSEYITGTVLNDPATGAPLSAAQVAYVGRRLNLAIPTDNTIAALGTSITHEGDSSNIPTGVVRGTGYFAALLEISGGRLRGVGINGVPGDTTAQIRARVDNVIALKPAMCIVEGGANDVVSSAAQADTVVANLVAVYDRLLAAGIQPIALTPTPFSVQPQRAARLNARVVAAARARNIICIDTFGAVIDPLSGNWRSGLSIGDSLHPSGAGALVMANAIWDGIKGRIPTTLPYLTSWHDDPHNLLLNGTFQFDSGSGTANGWYTQGNVASASFSLAPLTGGIGNWQSITSTADNFKGLGRSITTNVIIPGHILEFAVRIDATALTSGECLVGITGFGTEFGGAGVGWAVVNNAIRSNGLFVHRFVAPPGTGDGRFTATVTVNGQGTLKVGQMTLVDLTALGIV